MWRKGKGREGGRLKKMGMVLRGWKKELGDGNLGEGKNGEGGWFGEKGRDVEGWRFMEVLKNVGG